MDFGHVKTFDFRTHQFLSVDFISSVVEDRWVSSN